MKNLSPRAQGLIAINLAAIIFGTAALYGKLDVSPLWIVDMRAAFAALVLLIFGFYKKDIAALPRDLWPIMTITGIILAIHWLTFFISVQLSGVAIATLTFASFPLFTVLLEAWRQKRKPYVAEIVAAVTIILAVALLVNPQTRHNNMPGAIAGLASGLSFAWFGHASKRLGKILSPLNVSFYQNLVVAIVLVPSLFFTARTPVYIIDWTSLILLGVVTTALMHQLYFYSLRRLSVTTCNGFVALEPVYAILFAALFFHEPVTMWVLISGALIIGASYVLLKLEPPAI